MKTLLFTALTAAALSSTSFAQCDMADVNGCHPAVPVETEILASCDIEDRGCFPVVPVEAEHLASCDIEDRGCFPSVSVEGEVLSMADRVSFPDVLAAVKLVACDIQSEAGCFPLVPATTSLRI
jgi:hypothetical protein